MADNSRPREPDDEFERRLYQALALLERAGEQHKRPLPKPSRESAIWISGSIKPSKLPPPRLPGASQK